MRRLVTRQHGKSRGPFKPLLVAFAGLYMLYASSMGQLSFWQLWGNMVWSSPRQLLEAEVSDASLAAADVQYAIEAPAPVSGFVHKSGPVKLFDWTPGNRSERHAEFNRWMHAAAADPDSELAAAHEGGLRLQNLPPVYPNCQVLVNHRYKFIFVRHPKSASSSLMVSFGTCSAGNTTDSAVEGGLESGRGSSKANPLNVGSSSSSSSGGVEQRRRLQVSSGWDRHQFGAACLEPMAATELPPEEVERIWREYFVFTVVRNPYQRMLSAYKFLLRKTRANPACATVRWGDHCRDPLALGRMCAANHECCPLPAGFYWHHVIDQGRCLLTEDGGWAVDYIATVERFNEQMREVLGEIDRRRHVELPPLRRVTRELAQQNEARNKGACAAAAEGGDDEQLDPESLVPEKTRVLVGNTWVPYNATVLLDRYCEPADYFRGEHEHCLLQARHFYSTDFEVLYSKDARRGKA